jgi:hypothetical protein
MGMTPNYDPKPLAPQLKIYDYTGTLQYTYEADAIAASPVKDFDLINLNLKLGQNGDFGNLVFVIDDRNDLFTDLTDRKGADFLRQWEIQLSLGKTAAGLSRWFYGKLFDATIIRDSTGLQQLRISCVGWGVVLRERVTRMIRNQKKSADGVTLDDTDNTTRLDNLVEDLFTDIDHQIDEDIPQLANITRNQLCTDCLSLKVANVNEQANSYAGFISRLATIANVTWLVDSDRDLIMRDPETHNSDFLFTNDLSGLDAQGWDNDKIGYILGPVSWTDSSAESMYPFIHSFGSFKPKLMVQDSQTPDAADNLDNVYHAIPVIPTEDNLFKIAIRSIKTGTPPTVGEIEIRGDDGTGKPDDKDIRRTISVPKATLQALGTSTPADWLEIPIKPKLDVTPGEKLHIVFKIYGTASNTYSVNYKSGTGTFHDSTDGISWTARTGQSAYRIYSARRLLMTLENTVVSKTLGEPREKLFPVRADLEEQTVRQAMLQASELLGKQRRSYDNITVSPVTDKIPLASYCRLQDVKTGLDVKANINGIEIMMQANSSSQLGADKILLSLDEFIN